MNDLEYIIDQCNTIIKVAHGGVLAKDFDLRIRICLDQLIESGYSKSAIYVQSLLDEFAHAYRVRNDLHPKGRPSRLWPVGMPIKDPKKYLEDSATVLRDNLTQLHSNRLKNPQPKQSHIDQAPPVGFLGGSDLADHFQIPERRRQAFYQFLTRKRDGLGDDYWHEVQNPKPNSPRYLYSADSLEIKSIAGKYQASKLD